VQGLIDELQASLRETRAQERNATGQVDGSNSSEQLTKLEKEADDFRCKLAQRDAMLAALRNRDAEMRAFIEVCRSVRQFTGMLDLAITSSCQRA
jgi:hypothetical protein